MNVILFYIPFLLIVTRIYSIICIPDPGKPVNTPIGKGFGENPGRVVWTWGPNSTHWDGKNDTFYWSPDNLDQGIVDEMMKKTIISLTNSEEVNESWEELFHSFNERRYGTRRGYRKGEKIAMKINLNGETQRYENNNWNQVSPQFLNSLLSQLVDHVGVSQHDITIYDASRLVEPFFYEPPQGISVRFPHVNLVDNNGGMEYVERVEVDTDSVFIFSNSSVSDYKGTKLPKLLTEARYVIEVDDFRGHTMAGITESGKNWFGSIYRPDAICDFGLMTQNPHWCPMTLHEWVYCEKIPMGTYSPFVDFLSHPEMGAKVMLFISDGLLGGPYEDIDLIGVPPVKFEMKPFNNWWSSSIFASVDPIALDSVLFDFLRNEKNVPYAHSGCIDNYMHEAALIPDVPSKNVYRNPVTQEVLSQPLGVHEHWNNVEEKKYSRNLGKDKGIELVSVVV